MNHGHTVRLSYDKIMTKFEFSEKQYTQQLCRDVLRKIGFDVTAMKFGRNQIFLRKKNEPFVDVLNRLDVVQTKTMSKKVMHDVPIRQHRVRILWVYLRFWVYMSKSQN